MADMNAIGIVVSDLERSKDFYRLLGLDLPDADEDGHLGVNMPNGTRLMFDTEDLIRSFMPEWSRSNGNQVSLAFECAGPEEVDDIYTKVVEAGFKGEKEPWDAFWGQRYALLVDPDDVQVNLYASLA